MLEQKLSSQLILAGQLRADSQTLGREESSESSLAQMFSRFLYYKYYIYNKVTTVSKVTIRLDRLVGCRVYYIFTFKNYNSNFYFFN